MAEAGYSPRSAARQFACGAGLCQSRKALERLRSCRRTADPVPLVSDAPARRAADERVETGHAQSAAPHRLRSGNRTHRSTRTRGHATCPSAAASMRRSKRLSGSQEPPRATNRLAASMMGPSTLSRPCRFERVVHTGELLGAQALDIQQTVSIDVENGKRPVHHARRCALRRFHDEAGLANALSGKAGNTSDVFPPQHSHEGRARQRMPRVVSREQEQLR